MNKQKEVRYKIESLGFKLNDEFYGFFDKYSGFEGTFGNAYVYFPQVDELGDFNDRYSDARPAENILLIGSDLGETFFGIDLFKKQFCSFKENDEQVALMGDKTKDFIKRIKNFDF